VGRILVVEDEPGLRELYKDVLSDEGYLVSEASDGVEGLEELERERPDLIVLDLMMPRMDGLEFCRRLRDLPQGASIPIIVVSANLDLARREIEPAGNIACLAKPFDLSRFVDLVDETITTKAA
jgi:two-component system, OmpR family, response regulator MprA